MQTNILPLQQNWSKGELLLFRFVFVLLLVLTIPLNASWYSNLFSIRPSQLSFQDLFQLTHHVPAWLPALVIAVIATAVWSVTDKTTRNYNQLYFWSRAVLRYRLALGVIVYGILLLIPAQIPNPTLSDLHTPYGDLLPWKVYFHSTAVASAGYRQTIGAIEIIGAVLLLFRRTVAFGSILILFVLVNIILANFAYDIGDHPYSIYLFVVALSLLVHDLPRLYTLLVKETKTVADKVQPVLSRKNVILQWTARAGFVLFTIIFLAFTNRDHVYHNWPYQQDAGLPKAAGLYNVSSFKWNDSLHPYSLTDTLRWVDVVFEKWNVLSVRQNKRAVANLSSPAILAKANYEFAGNGGRTFYQYHQAGETLKLVNPNDSSDRIDFIIARPDSTTIRLSGKNPSGDSLSVVLNRVNKQYLLFKGRRKPISIY